MDRQPVEWQEHTWRFADRSQPGQAGMIFRTSYQTPKGTRCAAGRLRMENSEQNWGVDTPENTLEERRETEHVIALKNRTSLMDP